MATGMKNESFLKSIGFIPDETRSGVLVYPHPRIPKVKLVAFGESRNDYFDLFTEFGSSPLNTPGDPMNICIRIQDHDYRFATVMANNVVQHFLSLKQP